MSNYSPKNQSNIISRFDLIMYLGRKYSHLGDNPFVIKRDGKQIYNILNDVIEFTCCTEPFHTHRMTVMQLIKMTNKYPDFPCPICNAKGIMKLPSKGRSINDSGDEGMFLLKEYGGDNINMENREIVNRVLNEIVKDAKNKNTTENDYSGDGVVASCTSTKEYLRAHPEFKINQIQGENANKINEKFNKNRDTSQRSEHEIPYEDIKLKTELDNEITASGNENNLSQEELSILDELNSASTVNNEVQQVKTDNNDILSSTENENIEGNSKMNNNDNNEEEIELTMDTIEQIGK